MASEHELAPGGSGGQPPSGPRLFRLPRDVWEGTPRMVRRALMSRILIVIITLIVAGVTQGTAYALWTNRAAPWLLTTSTFALPNVVPMLLGFLFFVMLWIVSALTILTERRSSDRYEFRRNFETTEAEAQRLALLAEDQRSASEEQARELTAMRARLDEMESLKDMLTERDTSLASAREEALRRRRSSELAMRWQQILLEIHQRTGLGDFAERRHAISNVVTDILRDACAALGATGPMHGCVLTRSDDRRYLQLSFSDGVRLHAHAPMQFYVGDEPELRDHRGTAGYVFVTFMPKVVDNVLEEESYRRRPNRDDNATPYRSLLCVPIHTERSILGVLCIDGRQPRCFDREVDVLTAQLAASAIAWALALLDIP